jgi:hypothetical protein|uniref:hypothetical protein n=1 Tax=Algoriphagus sp. TaxID=1872435 RepID=UPI00404849EF
MKKLLFSFLLLLTASTSVWAQVPQQISYQSVIRDGNNKVIAASTVGIKISLIQGTATGSAVYVETHSKTTNANGLVSLEIGTGTVLSGSFASIDWANGPYLIKTETDPTGGVNYSIPAVMALNSVPYALYAANGTPGPKGDTGLQGTPGPKGDKGDTGATGAKGDTGAQGATGAAGPKGDTGLQGATGPAGPQGVAGPAGVSPSTSSFVDLTSNQTVGGTKTVTNPIVGSVTGSSGSTTGNAATATLAATATKLATPRNINGVAFDGSADVTVTADAGTLTGSNLNATVTGSSLTSVGTLANLTVTNPISGSVTGNAATVTTNANLTGDVTSVGNATTIGANKVVSAMIADGTILTGDLANDAIETAKIKDANVTNAKLDKTNIPLSGFGAAAADVVLGSNRLTGVADPVSTQDAATKAYVDAKSLPTATTGDMLYYDGTAWVNVPAGSNGQMLGFWGGKPVWQTSGFGVVTNSTTGRTWMDRNLGASRIATSMTDILAVGSLYQWGRGSDGHEVITYSSATAGTGANGNTTTRSSSATGTSNLFIVYNGDWLTTKDDNLWQGVNGLNNPCPSSLGFRLPTYPEWVTEVNSWSATTSTGAFNSLLRLPQNGRREEYDGIVYFYGRNLYWSSTISGSNVTSLELNPNFTSAGVSTPRGRGLAVRCILD